jgi:hypothetical protein
MEFAILEMIMMHYNVPNDIWVCISFVIDVFAEQLVINTRVLSILPGDAVCL